MALTLDTYSKSIPGSVHPHEDRILVDEKMMLYAVADGVTMSSQGSGGIAAELAIKLLQDNFAGDVVKAVKESHSTLNEMKLKDNTIGETTIAAACMKGSWAEVVNVGDSPVYLARGGGLQPLFHEDKDAYGYITQVIGYPDEIRPHFVRKQLHAGDYLLLASDGVAHVLSSPVIAPMVKRGVDAREVVETIIAKAREDQTSYDDDKSVIVLRIVGV